MRQHIGRKDIFMLIALPHTEEAVSQSDSGKFTFQKVQGVLSEVEGQNRRRMTMSQQTLITTRDPKGLHAVGLFKDVYNKAKLDDKCAQLLNERGYELQDAIARLITDLTIKDRYADEEVRSSYTYPQEYKGPKPIEEQIKALANILDLDQTHALEFAKNLPELPKGAEGWFAIPLVNALAKKHFPEVTDPARKYCCAVELVLMKIEDSRLLLYNCEFEITPAQLRVHARTANALDLVAENQSGDILIVAAQLGMRHRGRSVRRAREVFAANEFGIGSVAVASIVLTHPERLVRFEELGMDCAGDDFFPNADTCFPEAPMFSCTDLMVEFNRGFVNQAEPGLGSVSGFISTSSI